jgi:hypothetical protein
MGKAAIELKLKLQQKHELQCHAMLFEGQGILGVFLSFLEQFNSDLKEKHPTGDYPPEQLAILNEFKGTRARLQEFQEEFNVLRAYALLDKISKAKVVPVLQAALRDLYKTDLTTTAFQIALFATFYFAVEALNKKGQGITLKGDENESKLFEEYMNSLNPFFKPTSDADVKRLLNVFVGTVSGAFGTTAMKVVPSDKTLRSIVIPGELRPEEWNKFRYILLELWHTSNPNLQEIINGYISICRFEVAKSYYHRQLSEYCHEKGIDITDITANQKAKFLKSSLKGYRDALSDLTAVSDGEWSSITDKLTKDLLTPEAEEETAVAEPAKNA